MKKSKKNYIAIVLVVLLLALAVGYAAFSQTLTISGTANASGKWDVKFTTATISQSIVTGAGTNTATPSTDGKSITVTVNLATPGDGANIHTVITNAGNVDAKLKTDGFKVTGTGSTTFTSTTSEGGVTTYKSGAILVKVPAVTAEHTIAATETKTFDFSVEWDPSVTELADTQTATFTITFDYEQDGVGADFTGTQAFN